MCATVRAVIEVDRLVKRYGPSTAVDGLAFRVEPRTVLGLVGPNGAGKTTTLRTIAGILRPTEGAVRIAGFDLATHALEAKRRLAFVPDEPHLYDALTVEEHLHLIGRLYGVADAPARLGPLLAEVELEDRRRSFPDELSRGMRQKLAIACALLHDPVALLLDEPLTGLDPGAIRRMKATILARAEAGAAVILSSHLLHLVEELCTVILVVKAGRAVAHGSLEEIVAERPQLAGLAIEDLFLALTADATEAG